jgi:hypothetical protein
MRSRSALCTVLLGFVLAAAGTAGAQQRTYNIGQNVVPVFEGWERNPDGTFTMVFGYFNRNLVEEPVVPIGAANTFEPGEPDRGQPTHFYPRRQQFIFSVKVPKDWGNKELVWTLTSNGKTEKAYGSLLPVWEIGVLVWQENRGAAGTYELGADNDRPVAKIVGGAEKAVAVNQPLSLTIEATDDGRPKPVLRKRPRPATVEGDPANTPKPDPITQMIVKLDPGVKLGVTWTHHRGPGRVTFSPMRQPIAGDKATTRASFSQPGTYVVRAYADDGIYTTPVDVTVTVSAPQTAARQP